MPSRIHSLYGCAAAEALLDGGVVEDPSRGCVDEQQSPRLEAPFACDLLFRQVEHARLGRHHDEAVLRDEVSRRAQAVAIKRRADHAAVGERDGCRPIPRLEQRAVELVERAPLVVHQRVLMPRLRDHHHHRVLDRPAGHREQLERVVELRGVRAALIEHRHELGDVVAEMRAAETRLTCAHPVDIAAQRVDLAVVRGQPERLREVPARQRHSWKSVRARAQVPRSRARRPGPGRTRRAAPQSASPCRRRCGSRSSPSGIDRARFPQPARRAR